MSILDMPGDNNSRQQPVPAASAEPPRPMSFDPPPKAKKQKSEKKGKTLFWIIIVVAFMVLAVGVATYFAQKYSDANKELERLSDPQVAAQQELDQILAKVGSLTVLPEGEKPTLATVTDVSKLADQPFFANAQTGDRVLIYTNAKKAYLYRPSTNQIINIAPINIGEGENTEATSTEPTTEE
jgi:cytoskeletal protein RodZ